MYRLGTGIIGVLLVLAGCGRTSPQRPTFRSDTSVDTTAVQLLTMHQQMAAQADIQLARIATPEYVLMEENYWVSGLKEDLKTLQGDEYISMEAAFYSLDGKLLVTHQASVQVERVDDIQAIAWVIPKMQRGMHVSMLVPWYLAFGSAGNNDVLPYENVRVELQVE